MKRQSTGSDNKTPKRARSTKSKSKAAVQPPVEELVTLSSTSSTLEKLPQSLLSKVGCQLTVDEICCRLRPLNKFVKQTVNQSMSQSAISLDLPNYSYTTWRGDSSIDSSYEELCRNRLPYIKSSSRVVLNLMSDKGKKSLFQSISQATKEGLLEGHIKSLFVREEVDRHDPWVVSPIIEVLNQSNIQLEELWIDLVNRKMKGSAPLTVIDWSPLKTCRSLKMLRVDWNWHHQSVSSYSSLDSLMASLPDQLEELIISSSLSASEMKSVFADQFRSTTWLPSLKKFWCFGDISSDPVSLDLLPLISQTIMQATNKVRPIEAGMFETTSLDTLTKLPLTQLHTNHITDQIMEQLASQSTNQQLLPNLSVVNVQLLYKHPLPTHGFDPLFSFLSHRTIKKLTLSLPSNEKKASRGPLTRVGLQALASMKSLQSLNLSSSVWSNELASSNISQIIPSGCWPMLEDLHISAEFENVLIAMVAASPNVITLNMGGYGKVSIALKIAMTLHFCRSIVRAKFSGADVETVTGVRSAFERFPTPADGAQNLMEIECSDLKCTEATLHCLIRYLSVAPKLSFFSPRGPPVTKLTTCMMRSLRGLRSMYQLNQDAGIVVGWVMLRDKVNLSDPRLNACLETKKPINKLASSVPLRDDRYLGHWRAGGLTWADIAASHYAPDPVYRQFKETVNGVSGREQYFNELFNMLSGVEKARLTAWDNGDYTQQGVSSIKS